MVNITKHQALMGLRNFLISRTFLKHLSIAVAGIIVLVWIAIKSLAIYTNHGEEIEVPDLIGLNYLELKHFDPDHKFKFLVIDSIFNDSFQKGSIVLQDPPAGSKVKIGRKIYLTVVTSQPEMVLMPNLVDLSLRQAIVNLKAANLKVEKLSYIENMAVNAVLSQKFKGEIIEPGTEILKNSPIELVVGKGLREEKNSVPNLIGKTEEQAIELVLQSGFNKGYLTFPNTRDTGKYRVYKQQPSWNYDKTAEFGSHIDLWFRSELQFNFDSLLQTLTADTLKIQQELTEPQLLPEQ